MAVMNGGHADGLLSKPADNHNQTRTRSTIQYESLDTFQLPRGDQRHYQQQFADMYFARLAQLKPAILPIAEEAFGSFELAGETARKVERVLDVRQGDLCWVIGTVYMDLPMKPNVLEDIGREHWIAAPPPRLKYLGEGSVSMMLEDESGRLKLTGDALSSTMLVTGAIVAVIGTENQDGDFEVLDIRVPDLPPQEPAQPRSDNTTNGSEKRKSGGQKIAIVSGLDISAVAGDTQTLDMLGELLTGELCGETDQDQAVDIIRLIIAGNALTHASPIPTRDEVAITVKGKQRKYGYDSTTYNSAPTDILDAWLASILPGLPVTLLPGISDPTATSLPQPPIHMAFFPLSRSYAAEPGSQDSGWFDSTTNPAQFRVGEHLFLATGGQPVNDIFRYLDSNSRVEMMEAMLRWRLVAPTAPDTLWCYPFQDEDRFVVKDCPHVFISGDQPEFDASIIHGPDGQAVRLIAVPSFKETGEVVLLDAETLECHLLKVALYDK